MKTRINIIIAPDYSKEIFKIHPRFSCIKTSNFGRVKELITERVPLNENISFDYKSWSDPIDMYQNGDGYYFHKFFIDGKQYLEYAHRLVAETFIGPIEQGKVVNHKNSKKDDNRTENLEIITVSQNNQHCYDNFGHSGGKIVEVLNENGEIISRYPTIEYAMRELGLSRKYIINRCNNPFPDLFGIHYQFGSR